jgi:hypothetical protein
MCWKNAPKYKFTCNLEILIKGVCERVKISIKLYLQERAKIASCCFTHRIIADNDKYLPGILTFCLKIL